MKKLRVTIDIEVDTETSDGIKKSLADISKNLLLEPDDVVGRFVLTTNFRELDNTSEFFLSKASFHKIEIISNENDSYLRVPFVSVWDNGVAVESNALVNRDTGEITDIEVAGVDMGMLDVCERQYVIIDNEEVAVYEDMYGYQYWADVDCEVI